MEVLPLLFALWRRRLLIAAGALGAIALSLAVGAHPAPRSDLAWTRVALDTPTSQLVESAPGGADSLPWRASLLMHLMATDSSVRRLAARIGVRPDQVTVVDPILDVPEVPASMPKAAADAAAVTVAPYILTVDQKNSALPIITIEARGPDAAGAKRLAGAAVGLLAGQSSRADTAYSSPITTGGGAPPRFQGVTVQRVGPLRSKRVAQRVLPIKQLGAPLFLFGLWCTGVVLVPWLRRRARGTPATSG